MEMHVPALLEMLDIPYSGAGPSCLGLCYNKSLVRGIAQSIDVPVPAETYFNSDDLAATIPSVFPALIKPNYGDSLDRHHPGCGGPHLGGGDHLPRPVARADAGLPDPDPGVSDRPRILDRHHRQSRHGYRVLPPLEVDYSRLDPALPQLLAYESKWVPDSPYWSQIGYREARLDEDARRKIVDYSNILFERLGCRDYARFDFRADAEGEIKLLEVNPTRLVLGRQAQPDGRDGGAALLRPAEADHRGRAGAGRGAAPGPRHRARRSGSRLISANESTVRRMRRRRVGTAAIWRADDGVATAAPKDARHFQKTGTSANFSCAP